MISILSATRMDGLDKWKRLIRLSGWLTPFYLFWVNENIYYKWTFMQSMCQLSELLGHTKHYCQRSGGKRLAAKYLVIQHN